MKRGNAEPHPKLKDDRIILGLESSRLEGPKYGRERWLIDEGKTPIGQRRAELFKIRAGLGKKWARNEHSDGKTGPR